MAENIYPAGTTVRISCVFQNFKDENKDPDIIKVKIYDQKYNIIHEDTITPANRIAEGEYFYDYETLFDIRQTKYYYEWYGEIMGSPSLDRGSFKTTFA